MDNLSSSCARIWDGGGGLQGTLSGKVIPPDADVGAHDLNGSAPQVADTAPSNVEVHFLNLLREALKQSVTLESAKTASENPWQRHLQSEAHPPFTEQRKAEFAWLLGGVGGSDGSTVPSLLRVVDILPTDSAVGSSLQLVFRTFNLTVDSKAASQWVDRKGVVFSAGDLFLFALGMQCGRYTSSNVTRLGFRTVSVLDKSNLVSALTSYELQANAQQLASKELSPANVTDLSRPILVETAVQLSLIFQKPISSLPLYVQLWSEQLRYSSGVCDQGAAHGCVSPDASAPQSQTYDPTRSPSAYTAYEFYSSLHRSLSGGNSFLDIFDRAHCLPASALFSNSKDSARLLTPMSLEQSREVPTLSFPFSTRCDKPLCKVFSGRPGIKGVTSTYSVPTSLSPAVPPGGAARQEKRKAPMAERSSDQSSSRLRQSLNTVRTTETLWSFLSRKGIKPIIIVPTGTTALINSANVREFLEQKKVVPLPTNICHALPSSRLFDWRVALPLNGNHAAPQTLTIKVVDTTQVSKFTCLDWYRVIATFTNGPEWQFARWPFASHRNLFSCIRGVYLAYEGDKVPPLVKDNSIDVIRVQRNARHSDAAAWLQLIQSLLRILQLQRDFKLYDRELLKSNYPSG